jgi:hypothetical protein
MNLELRKAALEADGYWLYRGRSVTRGFSKPQIAFSPLGKNGGHVHGLFDPHGFDVLAIAEATDDELRRKAPAVESDPGASEPWFLEWCEKNGYEGTVSRFLDGTSNAAIFQMDGTKAVRIVDVDAPTNSEARAKAVVEAARRKA